MVEAAKIYSGYDSRQEFTENLQEQTKILYHYYMQNDYAVVLKGAHFVFLTVRALLNENEKTSIQKLISTAYEYNNKNKYLYETFAEAVLEVLSSLFDAIHNHKLWLPTYEDSSEEEDIDKILLGGGL